MTAVLRLNPKPPPTNGVDFEQLFDSLPDPAVYVGPDKRIAACNQAFRDRFPILVESRFLEPLHNPLSIKDPIEGTTLLPCVEPKRQSIAGGKTWPALQPDVTQLTSGGMLVVFKPISSAELGCLREIDELRQQLHGAKKDACNAMDTVAKHKKNFANAGHELRTPLNAIVGFSDMMRQQTYGPLRDARYERYADIIHDSGLHLLGVINDILDFSKLDAGKLELRVEQVEVLRAVIDNVRELELLAASSRIGVRIHACDAVSIIVADKNRLRQMLTNLLCNGLKFTPEGGEICIDVYKRGQDAAISISDTGIGMHEAEITTALEPFGQVQKQTKSDHAGTGLGLPLTKQLAELHGGAMEIESVSGFGTTVTILLPSPGANSQDDKKRKGQAAEHHYMSTVN